jgi:PAS domain S-box-containing protein
MGGQLSDWATRLQELERQVSEYFDDPTHIVYTHDLDGNFTSINATGERLSGYRREEILNANIRDVLPPEYHETVAAMIRAKLEGQSATSYEVEIVRKDGERVWLELHTRLQIRDGKPVGILGFARDISYRKRFQSLLGEIAAATAAESGADFFESFVEHVEQLLNAEVAFAAELLEGDGRQLRTLAARCRGESVTLECEVNDAWSMALESQSAFVEPEWSRRFPDDPLTRRFSADSVVAAPLRDPFGKPIGLLAALFRGGLPERAIAESALTIFASRAAMELSRGRAEQRAREAEYRYRSFIEHSSEAICRIEMSSPVPVMGVPENRQVDLMLRHGVIAECNDAYARLRGMPYASTMVGVRLLDLAEAGSTLERDLLAQAVRSGYRLARWEHGSWLDSRRERRFVSSVVAMGESGYVERVWCVLQDVTEQREATEALASVEQRHSLLFQTMAAGALYVNRDGVFVAANTAAAEILGGTVEDLKSRSFPGQWRCMRADGTPLAVEDTPLGIALRTGKPVTDEIFAVWNEARQQWRWVLANAVPSPARSGQESLIQVVFSDVTDLRRAQLEARESEQRFRSVIESSPIAMHLFRARPDGAVVFEEANQAAIDMFHAKPLAGTPLVEALPAHSSMLAEGVLKVATQGGVWHVDRFFSESNQVFEIHAFQTSPGHVAVMYQDITERSRAEEALRRSEEQFRLLWEHSHDGMRLTDLDGRILRVNEAYCQLVGLSRERLEGQLITASFAESDADWILDNYRSRVVAGPPLTRSEADVTLWDGRKVALEVSQSLVVMADGRPAVLSILRDVTERRRAERALKQSERRLRDLLESASVAGVITDAEGRINFCNGTLLRATGRSLEEVAGQPFLTSVVPADLPRATQYFDQILSRQSERARFECGLAGKDGRVRVYDWSASPLRDADGHVVAVAILGVDVTEQRAMEEQQRWVQKMESLGRVAGGIAHDFNNLLTVINGYGDLVLSRVNPRDPLYSPLTQMRKAGQRAAELTSQLLAFGRKQVLQMQTVDLNRLIEEDRELFARLLGHDVDFDCRLAADLRAVEVDPAQMHQVILSLVMNSRDAMPEGGRLTISTRNLRLDSPSGALAPGEYVELAIEDTGCGISPAIKERIFEPFFTTKGPGKGTGLGLSTAYGVVKQSGGEIIVDSEVDQGACFRVILPAKMLPSVPESTKVEAPGVVGGTETILLVEDNPSVRQFVRTALENLGYTVIEAAGAREALELLTTQRLPIHLLVADVVMPVMKGPELVSRLRQHYPRLPVLYISGYSDDSLVQQDISRNGAAFLQKPFSTQQIAATVKKLLSSSPSRSRILVVDDEEDVRRYMVEVLRQAGYQAAAARNGREALSQLAGGGWAMVITDLVMPEQEGMETIGEIRRRYPEVPIVAISGAFGARYLKMAEYLGASRTIAKPVAPDKLVEVVAELLAG